MPLIGHKRLKKIHLHQIALFVEFGEQLAADSQRLFCGFQIAFLLVVRGQPFLGKGLRERLVIFRCEQIRFFQRLGRIIGPVEGEQTPGNAIQHNRLIKCIFH